MDSISDFSNGVHGFGVFYLNQDAAVAGHDLPRSPRPPRALGVNESDLGSSTLLLLQLLISQNSYPRTLSLISNDMVS